MGESFCVSFADAAFGPLEIAAGTHVSLHLTVQNSPILFGCRTGLCGTCAALVTVLSGSILPPSEEEVETLELAFDVTPPKDARLLCQLRLTGDIHIALPEKGSIA